MSDFASNINESILQNFPNVTHVLDNYRDHNYFIDKVDIHGVVEFLKNEGFIYLTDLTGSHYPDKENTEFQVVYHIHNLVQNVRFRLKVDLSQNDTHIPTVTDLFAGANWMERETFDFFGIIFDGHPNLTRILNVEDMDYHPMKKEYALEDETRTDKDDTFFGR